jgi:RimJ/RimL family protein N-acetyltransferase
VIDQEQPLRRRALSGELLQDTSPAQRPQRIIHEGRYVRLEPIDPSVHVDELWEVAGDPAVDATWEYLGYGPWDSKEQYGAWLAESQASNDPLFFAIRDLKSGKAIGTGSIMRIAPEARSIEVGHIWFSPALQRTPAATEAIYLMIRHCLDDLGYRRMEWKCNALNMPSRRSARRYGFTYEGIFYQNMMVKGRNRDTAWYSILDGEWPEIRANFEAWLDPENFDEQGVQRRALAEMNAALL